MSFMTGRWRRLLAVAAAGTFAVLLLLALGLPWLTCLGGLAAALSVLLMAELIHKDAWSSVGRLLGPPGALGRALMPLLLAVIVVVAFASQTLRWPLEFLVGIPLVGLVWLFFRGGGEFKNEQANRDLLKATARLPVSPWRAEQTPAPASRWAFVLPVVVTVVVTIAFLYAGFGFTLRWESVAGTSGALEYVALTMLVVAAALRLVGYATSWSRRVLAVAVALLVVRTLSWAGIFRFEGWWGVLSLSRVASGVALLIVVTLVVEALTLKGSSAPVPDPMYRLSRASGFYVAVGSAILLAGALAAATWETTKGPARSQFGAPAPAPDILPVSDVDDLNLAWTFAPVLHLHGKEEYPPVAIDVFLDGATEEGALRQQSDVPEPLGIDTLPVECPEGGNNRCGTISCPACASRKQARPARGFVAGSTLYARIVRPDTHKWIFADWDPWRTEPESGRLSTLIQYWIFYGHNRWEAETVLGRLVQEHQGDWEVVSVGLDATDKPLFVALSAHCGGQVVEWEDIPAVPGRLVGGRLEVSAEPGPGDVVSHPVVAVAKGSHGNYAVAAGHRPPDWGSCKNLPSEALAALSYASNVRDLTDTDDTGWFTYPREIVPVIAKKPPMGYPGAWGDGETMTFGFRKPATTARSPLSPPLQGPSWHRPLHLFFCGSRWHADGEPDIRLHGSKQECRENARSTT